MKIIGLVLGGGLLLIIIIIVVIAGVIHKLCGMWVIGWILHGLGACPSDSNPPPDYGSPGIVLYAMNGEYFLCQPGCQAGDLLNFYDPQDSRKEILVGFDKNAYFTILQQNHSATDGVNQVSSLGFVKTIYEMPLPVQISTTPTSQSNATPVALPVPFPVDVTNPAGLWDAFGPAQQKQAKLQGWAEIPNDGQHQFDLSGNGPLPGDMIVWTGGPGGAGNVGIIVTIVDKNGKHVPQDFPFPVPRTSGSVYVAMADHSGNYVTQDTTDPNADQSGDPAFPFTVPPGIHLFKIDFNSNGTLQNGLSSDYTLKGFIRDMSRVTNGPLSSDCPPDLKVGLPQTNSPYLQMALSAAANAHYCPTLFARQIYQESGFDPKSISPKNAQGIAQFIPDTARQWGLIVTDQNSTDPAVNQSFDPTRALAASAKMMASLYQHYLGTDTSPQNQLLAYKKALAAYNWGAGGVQSCLQSSPLIGGSSWELCLPGETQNYIKSIMGSL